MRVLIVPYPWEGDLVGGHVTQQVETVRALRRLGVEAEIASIADAVGADVDAVHAFEDIRPLLAAGRPRGRLVVTPIYFPKSYVLGPKPMYWRGGRRQMLDVRLRHQARTLLHPRARRRRVADFRAMHAAWRKADLVIVNSKAERDSLRHDAPRLNDVRVAYSGVAGEAFEGAAADGRRLLGIGSERFVLSVARIEPRKNQLSLALALRGLPVRLVLVGAVLAGNEPYLAAVREALPEAVHVPHVDHRLLPHVHAAAAAHALPSWYETTGLSTLEALAAGRPVVVARGPCVEEYFSGCATFCDAGDIGSIRRAVVHALDGPFGCERDRARQFSWDCTARELLEAYLEVTGAV